ncbi:MAG: sugar transferase [Isosphaeraceae bacterium]
MSCPAFSPPEPQPLVREPRSLELSPPRGLGYETSKRLIDVTGAVAGLILCFPLLVGIAVGVKLTSQGPILFSQRRLGRNGALFRCYKFRTMVCDAEAQLHGRADLFARFDENFKLRDDPRVTSLGAFLRRTSLDELPQLWNVLRGEMSLIGPRPIVEPELKKYGAFADRLLTVKPGLGGLWQVNGRSDTTYPQRVAMDMSYIESRSIGFDLRLFAKTALVVLRGRGAY